MRAANEQAEPAATGEIVLYDTALFPALLDQDPAEVQARFARRFVAAETLDDLFDVLEGNNSKGMVGRRVQVDSVNWAPYESDQGVIPLAIVTAIDLDSGEVIEFATTSGMLVLFIRRAEIIGQLGFQARVTEKVTRSGRKALNFERV